MALRSGLRWSCWPDEESHLLLVAVLHRDDGVALDAWHRFRVGLDLSAPVDDQWRLLGHMAQRLPSLDRDDPMLPALQGIARTIAAGNLTMLLAADQVVDLLDGAGLEPVMLKGSALLLSVYDTTGSRPVRDVDVLVAPARHADAVRLLEANGWVSDTVEHMGNHGISMVGGPVPVDVHRAVNRELVSPEVAENGWGTFAVVESPRPLPSGRHVRVLAATDATLHTIVHGLQCNSPVNLRWVDDVAQLLRSGAVDGDRLCVLAERFAVAPVVHDALVYVDSVTGGLVDPVVLSRLRAIRTTRLDDLRLRAFHERIDIATVPPMRSSLRIFLQRTKGRRAAELPGLFPRSLLEQFGVDGWWPLLRTLVGLELVRIGRWMARSAGTVATTDD